MMMICTDTRLGCDVRIADFDVLIEKQKNDSLVQAERKLLCTRFEPGYHCHCTESVIPMKYAGRVLVLIKFCVCVQLLLHLLGE